MPEKKHIRKKAPGEGKGRSQQRHAANDPAGLPNKDSIIDVETVTSPKGDTYRILRTTEMDPYDTPDTRGESDR